MVRSSQFMGAALLTLAFASHAAEAQTQATKQSSIHARATHRHRVEKPQEEGRQITVHKSTPSWLTLGNGATVGYGNNYVANTFDQPPPIEGTFSGYRGREPVRRSGRAAVPVLALGRWKRALIATTPTDSACVSFASPVRAFDETTLRSGSRMG